MKNKISTLIIYCITSIFFILMVGNILAWVPVLGDISTSITGSLIHVWIIFSICLGVISAIHLIKLKNKTRAIFFLINTISIIICVFVLIRILVSFNTQGANVKFFKAYNKEKTSGVITEKKEYTDSQGKKLPINIYYLEERDNKPIILYIHGGGWIHGSENNNEYTSKVLAKKGFVVASIGYELSNQNNHLWDKTEKQILDGMNYLNDYLDNKNDIFMIGDSAGGNLALEISYKINNEIYKEVNGKALPKVKAISLNYPVTNPKDFYNNTNIMGKNMSKKMASAYTGGSPQEFPERYEAISPQNYISNNTPPTLIIVGENDALVPPQATYSFSKILDKSRIKNKLVKVPYFGHVADKYHNNLFNQAYIDLTIKWFLEK